MLDPRTRESRGFGFVTMEHLEDAERCIKYLNRSTLEGRIITVEKVSICRVLVFRTSCCQPLSPNLNVTVAASPEPDFAGLFIATSWSSRIRLHTASAFTLPLSFFCGDSKDRKNQPNVGTWVHAIEWFFAGDTNLSLAGLAMCLACYPLFFSCCPS